MSKILMPILLLIAVLFAVPASASDIEKILGALLAGYIVYEVLDGPSYSAPQTHHSGPPPSYHYGPPQHSYGWERNPSAWRFEPPKPPPSVWRDDPYHQDRRDEDRRYYDHRPNDHDREGPPHRQNNSPRR